MRSFEIGALKYKVTITKDGSRLIKNIADIPTVTKKTSGYADGLRIEIDTVTGIPKKPGTDDLLWQPEFHRASDTLDCRSPWDRQADPDYRTQGRFYPVRTERDGEITWDQVLESSGE
jgi:hypothetical protein